MTPSTAETSPSTPPAATAVDRARARVMAMSLKVLLDRVRGSREALPHLAALETVLPAQGLGPLDTMSVTTLSRICTQLASLPVGESDAPLQDLQNRLLAAVARRNPAPAPGAGVTGGNLRSLAATGDGSDAAVVVSEITHSAFMAALQERQSTVPMALVAEPAVPDQLR
jgi:hypothetical protein